MNRVFLDVRLQQASAGAVEVHFNAVNELRVDEPLVGLDAHFDLVRVP